MKDEHHERYPQKGVARADRNQAGRRHRAGESWQRIVNKLFQNRRHVFRGEASISMTEWG